MKLEHISQDKLTKQIKDIVGRHLDLNQYKLFFFGSRVSGGSDEHSDIDLGIKGKQKVPLAKSAQIKDEIDNLPTLYKIELVDFERVSSEFRQVAMQNVEYIN